MKYEISKEQIDRKLELTVSKFWKNEKEEEGGILKILPHKVKIG